MGALCVMVDDGEMRTPTTPRGLAAMDNLPAHDAVLRAWTEPGPRPGWHEAAQCDVAAVMPDLARALHAGDAPAAARAWQDSSGLGRGEVRKAMPVLARALDRAVNAQA